MEYKELQLSSIMTETEFEEFERTFVKVGKEVPQILGILATGSLFQHKDHTQFKNIPEKKNNNYFSIDASKCRKIGFDKNSDVDIWVILKDHNLPSDITQKLDKNSIEIMEKYSTMGLESWAELCQSTFGEYCKNKAHYEKEWIEFNNNQFWESQGIQTRVTSSFYSKLKDFCGRIHYFFDKRLDKFLEIRAFPESLLNVKLASVNTVKYHRVPIPIYLKSWLTKYNTHVLYADKRSNIFPFKPNGAVLGERIGVHFGLDKLSDEELYLRKF